MNFWLKVAIFPIFLGSSSSLCFPSKINFPIKKIENVFIKNSPLEKWKPRKFINADRPFGPLEIIFKKADECFYNWILLKTFSEIVSFASLDSFAFSINKRSSALRFLSKEQTIEIFCSWILLKTFSEIAQNPFALVAMGSFENDKIARAKKFPKIQRRKI